MSSVISHLVGQIRNAAAYNPNTQHAPAAILWTDKERQWESVLPLLRDALPELFLFGEYNPETRSGPAIWLKCIIAKTLEWVEVPENLTPILYIPGISRSDLRDIEHIEDKIKPLAELQYRGVLWSQYNGKDWTANAYLTSEAGGLGLDVAKDKATQDALLRALPEILSSDVSLLEHKRLEASDFNQLLSNDPVRDLLTWMNSPKEVPDAWGAGRWQAFCNEIKSQFGLDVEKDGEFAAAEKLCASEVHWENVWQRYCDSPDIYPSVIGLLERVPVPDLLAERERYPQANLNDEKTLLTALYALTVAEPTTAREKLLALNDTHALRRDSLWAKLGKSPWAMLLEPLAEVATRTSTGLGGLSPQELGERYLDEGWLTDAAALQAIAMCSNKQQASVVEGLLATIYTPWLADLNECFQKHVREKGYPGIASNADGISEAVADYKSSGEVVFFVDGLRLDVSHQLLALFEKKGLKPQLNTQWSALPSVTATAKAAVSPIFSKLTGLDSDKDFEPNVIGDGALTHDRFKKELGKMGWQYLGDDETGDTDGHAWLASGDIDKEGHKSELKLAQRIPLILDGIVDRVLELQLAGWRKIRIVTDHGWLLVPGKMPKSNLPNQATESRWGRCAQLKQNVQVDGLTLGWHWNPNVPIHFPHGIHSFIAGRAYGHGGVSLQECLVPILTIEGEVKQQAQASIKSIKWIGLNCKVEVSSEADDLFADLRTKLADSNTTLVKAKKLKECKASLMILDDDNEGVSAMVVVYDGDGKVLAKQPTSVGGDE